MVGHQGGFIMAMSKGAKIAVGCAAAFFAVVILAATGLFVTGIWVKGKVEKAGRELVGEQQKITELQKKANAHPFAPPADGLIQEDRLVKFLNVRKRVFAVYERHKPDFEATDKSKPQGLEALKALGSLASVVNEIRLVQAEAMVDEGMSEAEYRFFVESVYKSMWASEVAKSTGGKSVSEAAGSATEAAAEAADQAEQAGQPPETVKAMRESAQKLRDQAATSREEARKLDVPPATLELYRKYEADIKKYAMSGLEMVGL